METSKNVDSVHITTCLEILGQVHTSLARLNRTLELLIRQCSSFGLVWTQSKTSGGKEKQPDSGPPESAGLPAACKRTLEQFITSMNNIRTQEGIRVFESFPALEAGGEVCKL